MSGTNYDDGTKSVLRKIGAVILAGLLLLLAVGVLAGLFLSPGCGVSALYTADGKAVPALQLGEGMPSEVGQFAKAAADFLPPPFNYIVGGIATLVLGGGGAAVAKRNADKARQREHAAWDESQQVARIERAERDASFDEGTQRAAVTASVSAAPVVVGVPTPDPAAVVDDRVASPQAGA